MENLIQPGILQHELSTGYLLVFPQWLNVCTYPFEGQGERKWVAANVALMDIPPECEALGIGPPIMSMGTPGPSASDGLQTKERC